MIKILFTFDYEVYGNGTGSLKDLVLAPTQKLLDIANEFGAKITLFPEVAEFLAMKQEKIYKSDIMAVEKQLQMAIRQGHDVQLHIHPQWKDASYKNGLWKLNYEMISIAELPRAKSLELIKNGKEYLENLLIPISTGYECCAFRAGYWCMMPSSTIIAVLQDAGIKADTSVYKWGQENGVFVNYDYSEACSNFRPWFVDPQNINQDSANTKSILEIPIYTEKALIISMITKKRLHMRKMQRESRKDLHPDKKNRFSSYLNLIRKQHSKKFDFCKLTTKEMIKMIDTVVKLDKEDALIPLCTIGHSKEFCFEEDFRKLLTYITSRYQNLITFDTLQNTVSDLVGRAQVWSYI